MDAGVSVNPLIDIRPIANITEHTQDAVTKSAK